ncbi:YcnI family protein [Catenulispora yoronensis]|uniref:YcnI family protein n=1 Tax=Catenulispora yoronensis TaxID=450799 RepID=A0ABP5GYG4_9ACTN
MTKKLTSSARRTAVLLSTAAVSLVAAAAVASAHVTVNPNTAQQGAYTKVSFRVPNEEKDQSTTSVEVDLPTDHPIASVSVKPVPGWTATATTSALATPIKTDDGDVTQAVTKIVWTGGKIDPGQFQEFDVSLGPLPTDTDQIVFKALQTYSDGTVVRWIDVPPAGQEADHPAPVLHLTPAGATGSAGAAASPSAAAPSAPSSSPSVALSGSSDSAKADDSDSTARILGIAGLVVGVLGFGTAIVALRRKHPSGS